MDRMENLLDCPVCLDRFKEPKMLPCQHTFCLRPCLEKIVKNNSIICPECRACHRLPSNGVGGLPTNLTIVRFLGLPNQRSTQRQCKECKMEDGDVKKCNHCDESLCRSCLVSHTLGLQQDLRDSLIQVTRLVSKTAESDSELRQRSKKLEENAENIKQEISQPIERFISELQSRKKSLLEELDALVATESGSLQREQEELELKMVALTTHFQVASEISKRSLPRESTHEIQKFQKDMLCLAQQGREHLQRNRILSEKIHQTIKFTNCEENVLLPAICNFGTVSAHAQQLTFKGNLKGELHIQVVPESADGGPKFGRRSARQQRDAQPSGEGSPPSTEPSTLRQPTADARRPRGAHLRFLSALNRYRNKGRVKKYFGTEGNGTGQMNCPRGISSTAAGDIVVADNGNHRIQIFDANGVAKGVIGSRGESDRQFDGVTDVCVTSRGWIVASDLLNHRIQIFDEYGRFVRKFGREGSGDGQLSYPRGVATDDKGLIYVCDENNHRVQVFSASGQFVRKFGSDGNRLESPQYLSVTSNSRVVVGDYSKHRVKVFDEYGRHLFELRREGTNASHVMYPKGLAADQHGNIIVGDGMHDQLQVFASDGMFVSSFASFGSDPGQMNGLEGVCFLLDGGIGNMAVSDSFNHRVQIF